MKRLGPWDSFFLATERWNAHNQTIKIAILDVQGPVDIDAVRSKVAHAVRALPPLTYQLLDVPFGFHRPLWRENCEIDVDYHVRLGRVPSPGGRRQLEAAIGGLASTPVNMRYPPWELHVLEGLEDGRVAAVAKIHHALADGVACRNLLLLAVTTLAADVVADPQPPDPVPTTVALAGLAVAEHARQLRLLPGLVKRTVRGARAQREFVRSAPPDLARIYSAPRMFWNRPLSAGRAYACESLPLPDVREMSKQLGLTINDVMLGIIAGGLRKLILDHGDCADRPLVASVPVSIGSAPQRVYGNELGGLNVFLPVHLDDPLARCHKAALSARAAKEEQRLVGASTAQEWLGFTPPRLLRWRTQRGANRRAPSRRVAFNLGISNVAASQEKLVVAGVPIAEMWSTGPLHFGCGIQISMWSYLDALNVSALTDSDVLPDAGEVTRALGASFEEARSALQLAR